MSDRLRPWVRATFEGWCLGVLLAILGAVLADSVGIGGAQFMLGLGMGLGVGWAQQRVLRTWVGPVPWLLATVTGLSVPFSVGDLLAQTGLDLPYSLPVYVALGGLLAGLLQAWTVRENLDRAWAWPILSVLAWSLAAATVGAADALDLVGLVGALAYLGVVALGGLGLGLVTAPAVQRLRAPSPPPRTEPHPSA